MLKLTTDRHHEASRGLFATAELLVIIMWAVFGEHDKTVYMCASSHCSNYSVSGRKNCDHTCLAAVVRLCRRLFVRRLPMTVARHNTSLRSRQTDCELSSSAYLHPHTHTHILTYKYHHWHPRRPTHKRGWHDFAFSLMSDEEVHVANLTENKTLRQEAQLSQRGRAMLRVTEYFASHSRSLKMVSFESYSHIRIP